MVNPYVSGVDITKSRMLGNPYSLQVGLTQDELLRVQTELYNWKWYKGDQWSYKRPEGEPQNTFNYSARFVDKGVSFLMGKGFTVNFETEAEKIIKPFVDKVLDDNNRLGLVVEMAQSGGVTGNAWVKVSLEEYDEKKEPMLFGMYPKGRLRISVLPSYACFPRWNNHDKDRMDSLKIIYPITIYEADKPKIVWYREELDNNIIREYLDDKLIKERTNDLGCIYVVRVKNIIVANDSLGKSDMQDVIPLGKEFNEKTTDVSDIINYHASPITIVYGAKTTNLEKGARKIWGGLPKDAKVENLELKTDLSASMGYVDFIKRAMFEMANMPEDALGASTNVSNTTGIALHIKNQPLLDMTNMKKITYGSGIAEIIRLVLRFAEVYELDGFDKTGFEALKPEVKWFYDISFPDPLPKDELIQMQLIAQKLTNHLTTHIDALKELGEHDAVKKWEEIKKEITEVSNLMFETMPNDTSGGGNGGNGNGGNPNGKTQPNIGGINRTNADLSGHTGRNHSKPGNGGV